MVHFVRKRTSTVAFDFVNSGVSGEWEARRTNLPSPLPFNDGYALRLPAWQPLPSGQGETLASAIKRLGARAIEPRELGRLIETVLLACDAVAHAHARGVIHGALNPSSIVHDGSGVVSGYGGGRDLQLGSPAYFSTEQAWGRRANFDARTDVYSFGAILFAILTGRGPHEQDTLELELASARRSIVRDPRALCPERSLPPALCLIALRALSASPTDRYPSIAILKQNLELFMRSLPASAPVAKAPDVHATALAS